ncbi:MAG: cation transporter [Rhodothermales bacterium]|nr:cation transporter [Rhodothermales bacterium]
MELTSSTAAAGATNRAVRRARVLEYLTLAWNSVEAVVGIGAGIVAGSTSLIGFGLDSVIESLSGGILLWRLRDGEDGDRRERIAQKLVGGSFFILGAYVTYESVEALVGREAPDASIVGIGLATLSLIVMPLLARAKRSAARSIGSFALESDSRQTDLCAYLSAVLLVGLGLNASLGWWWADPVAALGMVGIMVTEGVRAMRGETCETCHP